MPKEQQRHKKGELPNNANCFFATVESPLKSIWARMTIILSVVIMNRCFGQFKAAGDKLLMNKFIRQNFGEGRTLKSFRS